MKRLTYSFMLFLLLNPNSSQYSLPHMSLSHLLSCPSGRSGGPLAAVGLGGNASGLGHGGGLMHCAPSGHARVGQHALPTVHWSQGRAGGRWRKACVSPNGVAAGMRSWRRAAPQIDSTGRAAGRGHGTARVSTFQHLCIVPLKLFFTFASSASAGASATRRGRGNPR